MNCQPCRFPNLHGLANTERMHLHLAQQKARVLRLWKAGSRCSRMYSCAECLSRSPLSTPMPGRTRSPSSTSSHNTLPFHTDSFAINLCDVFGLSSAGGVYGSAADGGAHIMQGCGIGPVSKWVNDHIFVRIRRESLAAYNTHRAALHDRIMAHGGRHQTGGHFWFSTGLLDSGRVQELDNDNRFPLCDCSGDSP